MLMPFIVVGGAAAVVVAPLVVAVAPREAERSRDAILFTSSNDNADVDSILLL